MWILLSLKRADAASDYELKPAVNSTSSVGHKYVFFTVQSYFQYCVKITGTIFVCYERGSKIMIMSSVAFSTYEMYARDLV